MRHEIGPDGYGHTPEVAEKLRQEHWKRADTRALAERQREEAKEAEQAREARELERRLEVQARRQAPKPKTTKGDEVPTEPKAETDTPTEV